MNTKIKIEKGIKIQKFQVGRKRVYPFHEMEVGDSFLIPKNRVASVRHCAFHFGKQTGNKSFKISVRGIEKAQSRVWRTA